MSETTQSVPFRAPVDTSNDVSARTVTSQETSKANSTQYRAGSSDDPTPYVYGAIEGKPYSVKYLGIDLYHGDADFPEVREMAKSLDEYVIKQAKAQGLEDKHESYQEVIDAIYKQIGKSKNEDPIKSLKRLSMAAGAIERLNRAKLQPILSAKSLTAEEFEGIQR